jgi:hypothetical protein
MRSYEEIAELGRKMIFRESGIQWEWGELMQELVKSTPRKYKGRNTYLPAIEKFASDIDWPGSPGTLYTYLVTARAWPKKHRAKTSFKVHEILRGRGDRFDIIKDGMTCKEANDAAGYPEISRSRSRTQEDHASSLEALTISIRYLKRYRRIHSTLGYMEQQRRSEAWERLEKLSVHCEEAMAQLSDEVRLKAAA